MSRLITSFSLIVTLIVGCASPGKTNRAQFDRDWFWMPLSQYDALVRERDSHTPQATEAMAALASDATNERAARCQAVFSLFASYIRSGHDAKDMGRVLRDATWFHDADLASSGASGGQLPIYSRKDESMFRLSVLPDAQGWSDWVIYFTLSRPSAGVIDAAEARAFIRGTLPNAKVRLREFALCYPDVKIRRFTKQKVWLLCRGDFR